MFSIETIFWTQYILFCAYAQIAGDELIYFFILITELIPKCNLLLNVKNFAKTPIVYYNILLFNKHWFWTHGIYSSLCTYILQRF